VVHARFGRPIDAMPLVQKALELNTRRPALAYFVRAMAHEDSGNIAGAYYDLKRAQQLEPDWKEPQIELRRFQVSKQG
jgi:tetratricopeptide (TPR) repeat protein